MKIVDFVERVLRVAAEPLHYREITSRILADGWTTTGNTPWESVNARLAVDVKRGPGSRFVRTRPGMFGLNPHYDSAWAAPGPPIQTVIESPLERERQMSFSDAAEHILRESGAREPMHYATITELALDSGLIQTEGSTPAATTYSAILQEIRRRDARGEPQRFVQHGRGLVGLAVWVPRGLAARIEEHNADVRATLLEQLRDGSPQGLRGTRG